MKYILMRKDDSITAIDIDEDGFITKYQHNINCVDIAPLAFKKESNWIRKWWNNRSVPKTREGIAITSMQENSLTPSKYLLNNLGLSLTDYYWIKPIGSHLKWKDINLYDNNFSENLFLRIDGNDTFAYSALSPNSSLQGDLEKTWKIDNDKRILIKGNNGSSSEESINEVIASLLHKKQGYDNYTEYKLVKIPNRRYDFGCCCEAFTNQNAEFVSAWEIVTSDTKRNDESYYEHFIKICGAHGIDTTQLRNDLEYQLMADYILSNRDRHLNNIGILRDADTLAFQRMAPIFDSGKCMFVGQVIPSNVLDNEVNSFCNSEFKLLNIVRNKSLLDTAKLPTDNELYELYRQDSQLSEMRIENIIKAYNKKIDYFIKWQNE